MSKKRKKSRFGGNVARSAERDKSQSKGFGYLNLPKEIKMYKESPGRHKVDIIPYMVTDKKHPDYRVDDPESAVVDELWYRRPIQVHRGIGADSETVVCPKTVGKKCPICEEKDRQYKDGVESKDVIGKTSHRTLYYVIPKGHKDYDEEPHVWDISQFCFGDELSDEVEENPEFGVFPDLEQGMTLNIRFSEETFGKNKFAKASRIDFKDRKEKYTEDIIADLPSLDELFTIRPYKDLQKLFFEMEDEDLDNEEDELPFKTDDEDTPPKRKKKGLSIDKNKKSKSGVDDSRPSPDFSKPTKKKNKKGKKKNK